MRKVIAAINMTLDGFCDHTAGIADDELHQHYNEVLKSSDTLLYGRVTYQLMEGYWPGLVQNPSGNKAEDEFAELIDEQTKIVFSLTLHKVNWKNSKLVTKSLKEEVLELKQQPGKPILAGSPSVIAQLMQLNLIDEYQLCIHPIVLGNGLTLFKNINEMKYLKLIKTKNLTSGAIVLYYEPEKISQSED